MKKRKNIRLVIELLLVLILCAFFSGCAKVKKVPGEENFATQLHFGFFEFLGDMQPQNLYCDIVMPGGTIDKLSLSFVGRNVWSGQVQVENLTYPVISGRADLEGGIEYLTFVARVTPSSPVMDATFEQTSEYDLSARSASGTYTYSIGPHPGPHPFTLRDCMH